MVFVTCLVGAVFSDIVWSKAKERLAEEAGGGVIPGAPTGKAGADEKAKAETEEKAKAEAEEKANAEAEEKAKKEAEETTKKEAEEKPKV